MLLAFMRPPFSTLLRVLSCLALVALVVLSAFWVVARRSMNGWVDAPSVALSPRKVLHLAGAAMRPARATVAEQAKALTELMAGRPFVLVDDGQPQRFELSLQEIYLPLAKTGERMVRIEPQANARGLMARAEAAGPGTGWVIYPEGAAGTKSLRRVLGTRVLVKVVERAGALKAVAAAGLRVVQEPEYAPGFIIAEALQGGPAAVLTALGALAGQSAVESVGPLLLRQHERKLAPNDTLFPQQWHLKNTGQGGGGAKAGTDVNVSSVWDTYQGQGVRIAIVDDGLDLLHPDLAANADTGNHYDWNDLDTNPAPVASNNDFHGTSVGGVAAARGGNSQGVSGVAPLATLVGFRLIADVTSDAEDAEAMTRGNDLIPIKNNSWGFPDGGAYYLPAVGPLTEAARENATSSGRGGRGTIFVWAAGNGRKVDDQGNKDGLANSMHALTVGALANTGIISDYSETGSHIVTVAPSSGGSRDVVTTDLIGINGYNDGSDSSELADTNYTNDFGGTSSATPAVAGVVALMLQANPNLNWRDVKEILLRSSTQLFPTDTGWISRSGGNAGLAAIKHHQSYGGGLVNAQAAVTMATSWTSLGTMVEATRNFNGPVFGTTITDNNPTGIHIPFDFRTGAAMRVEHVTVRVDIYHTYRGDLEITLRSPGGTISTLSALEIADDGSDYQDWTFSSVRHWGESSYGTWTLIVKDLDAGVTGTFYNATVTLYGTDAPPAQLLAQPTQPQLLEEGQPLSLTLQSSGYAPVTHTWVRDSTNVVFSGGTTYTIPSVTVSNGGSYKPTVSNLTGTVTGTALAVGVVRTAMTPVTVNEGGTLILHAATAGPGLVHEWLKDGAPITNGGRITGATTNTLNVNIATPADAGGYVCRVSLPGAAPVIDTLPAVVTIRQKPVVTPPTMTNGVISGIVSYTFTADNGASKFTATGLPPGVTFNSTTGVLSGRPTKVGTYAIIITATNSAGTGAPVTVLWTVEDFPLAARGVWNGLVERETVLNGGFGGRLTLTVATAGTYTGKITLGTKSYSWTSRVDALPGNAACTTPFTIVRPKPLTALSGSFTLNLATGTLTGTLTDGSAAVAALSATRCPWSSTFKATAYAASYNAALQLPAVLVGDPVYPQGDGHATLVITTAGAVTWTGKLADGTALTGSSTLGPLGQVSQHLMLYTNTGSSQGWSTLTSASGLLDGTLDWLKNPQIASSTTRSYKAGIPLHVLTLRGAKFIKPATGQIVLGLAAPPPDNAELLFTGAPLAADIAQLFQISTTNVVKIPTTAVLNPQAVKLTLNATTGAISGSFTLKDNDPLDLTPPITLITRTANYSGVLVTRPDLTQGTGHFNLAELPDAPGEKATTTPIVSGKAKLGAP